MNIVLSSGDWFARTRDCSIAVPGLTRATMRTVEATPAAARVLVLGAGPSQLALLAAARRQGFLVVAADRDPGAPGFRYADRRALVDGEDEPAVERLARAERADAIVGASSDRAAVVAARVAWRLGLPHR